MSARSSIVARGALLLLAGAAGCHRARVVPDTVVPAPPLAQQHCWWTSLRTSLPPDSVAARFAAAFATLGFRDVVRRTGVDTVVVDDAIGVAESVSRAAIVHAATLAGDTTALPSARYEGLAVAWVRADTTRVRYYLARDPEMEGSESIGRCGALWRQAMTAPATSAPQ